MREFAPIPEFWQVRFGLARIPGQKGIFRAKPRIPKESASAQCASFVVAKRRFPVRTELA
jgi:hypothetical protein